MNKFFLFSSRFSVSLDKILHLGIKKEQFFLFSSRFSVSLDKILHLGIKKEQVLFVLLSIFRIFAPSNDMAQCGAYKNIL